MITSVLEAAIAIFSFAAAALWFWSGLVDVRTGLANTDGGIGGVGELTQDLKKVAALNRWAAACAGTAAALQAIAVFL